MFFKRNRQAHWTAGFRNQCVYYSCDHQQRLSHVSCRSTHAPRYRAFYLFYLTLVLFCLNIYSYCLYFYLIGRVLLPCEALCGTCFERRYIKIIMHSTKKLTICLCWLGPYVLLPQTVLVYLFIVMCFHVIFQFREEKKGCWLPGRAEGYVQRHQYMQLLLEIQAKTAPYHPFFFFFTCIFLHVCILHILHYSCKSYSYECIG